MKLLLGTRLWGWRMFGLLGRHARWFLGFSMALPRPGHTDPPTSTEWIILPATLTPEMWQAMDWAINDAWHVGVPVSPEAYAAAIGAAPARPDDACRPTASQQEQPETAGGPST